jgi:RNA polymerase sigma factor for flagellar operon FliA
LGAIEGTDVWARFLADRNNADRTRLIEAGRPIVEEVLRRFRNVRACDRDDLRGAGYLGLIRAVDEWNPERMPWDRFVRLRVKYAMVDHIRELSWVPKAVRSAAERLEAEEEALAVALGRLPTHAELAGRLGLSEDEVTALVSDVRGTDGRVISLDWRAESEAPWSESLCDRQAETPEGAALRREDIDRLELILQRLPATARDVLYWRFLGFPKVSQKEIARRLGVHESRISQIIAAAIEQARAIREQPTVLFPEVYTAGRRMTVRE